MPRAEKSLEDYLGEMEGKLSVNSAIQVLTDVTRALVAMDNHIIHRDLKPSNILLLDGR